VLFFNNLSPSKGGAAENGNHILNPGPGAVREFGTGRGQNPTALQGQPARIVHEQSETDTEVGHDRGSRDGKSRPVGGSGISRTPQASGPVRGVVDLRGRRIPVVDMRSCLHLPCTIESEKNCIIVADVVQAGRNLTVGLLVDEVCEVLSISEDEIHLPPAGGGGMEEIDFINGMGRLDDRDVVLVDVQHLLADDDLSTIDRMTH